MFEWSFPNILDWLFAQVTWIFLGVVTFLGVALIVGMRKRVETDVNSFFRNYILVSHSSLCRIMLLIEVNGSEFNLLNSNHYKELNHKVLEAAGQIRTRLGVIYRSFDSFRKSAHQIRTCAEKGEKIDNALLVHYSSSMLIQTRM